MDRYLGSDCNYPVPLLSNLSTEALAKVEEGLGEVADVL